MINCTGEMEVTVQVEDDRPPPPQEEQLTESQEARTAALTSATEIAARLLDSVLSSSATEVSRIQSKYNQICVNILFVIFLVAHLQLFLLGQQAERIVESSSTADNPDVWTPAELVVFSQSSSNDLSRENSVPIDWIRRFITDDNVSANSERKSVHKILMFNIYLKIYIE